MCPIMITNYIKKYITLLGLFAISFFLSFVS